MNLFFLFFRYCKRRSWENSQIVASYAVVVDPLDEEAKSFYLHYGFTELPDSGKMFIPIRTLDELFAIYK